MTKQINNSQLSQVNVNRALISVYDKTGIVDFARFLESQGVEIVSTGGTLRHLIEHGIDAVTIEDITGYPEILEGRVKTLHPKIHGGILATEDQASKLQDLNIPNIDLVVVNLYPFGEVCRDQDIDMETALDYIDIGGVTLIRAAAKNWPRTGVIVDPADYERVLTELKQTGGIKYETKKMLARAAFRHTTRYDREISNFLEGKTFSEDPAACTEIQLSYGENPHQDAKCYLKDPSLFHKHQGKDLSYNNLQDMDAAIELIKEFGDTATAVAIKHTNPCGVGLADDNIVEAFDKAKAGDPVSIFGGIVAVNRPVDEELAKRLTDIFLEVVIAPYYSESALEVLADKPKLRVIQVDTDSLDAADNKRMTDQKTGQETNQGYELKSISGGYLYQKKDDFRLTPEQLTQVSGESVSKEKISDMLIANQVVKHVKSNAIVIAKDQQIVGIGAGQMNRVGASRIALESAGEEAQDAVLASDAFFPFDDVVKLCEQYGISCVVQPGGSKRDDDSIAYAKEAGISMFFTGVRHFKH